MNYRYVKVEWDEKAAFHPPKIVYLTDDMLYEIIDILSKTSRHPDPVAEVLATTYEVGVNHWDIVRKVDPLTELHTHRASRA